MTLLFQDSATGDSDACPGRWFDKYVVPGIRAFRGQFGFFRFSALAKYTPALTSATGAGRPVRLVLGSNVTDPLTVEDVESVLSITQQNEESRLTVVALRDTLFHPKVVHVVQSDGSAVAMVGSANLTLAALGANVEAWLELSSSAALTESVLRQIERATDWWGTSSDSGVFQVNGPDDVRQLRADGLLIDRRAQQRQGAALRRSAEMQSNRGTRRRRWRPTASAVSEGPEFESEGAGEVQRGRAGVKVRWCKQLSASDALQTGRGTHPTGKLRLGQAGHDIDQATWFREVMFQSQEWITVMRGARRYEEAHVPFNVQVPGAGFGKSTLLIDHAPHRASNQRNVVTVLSWGTEIGQWLRLHSQKGKWVIIELDKQGEYWLRIRDLAPKWAPRRLSSRGPAERKR